jgi:Opioid growth factor receptor (OGFr) conserved region/Ulp1 protease family, C-terminal catalytic domain
MRLNTYIRLDVNSDMTVAKETYAIFDEDLKDIDLKEARTLKKTMVGTMVHGKMYSVPAKIHIGDNLFQIEAGQNVFHMKKHLMIFGKLGTDHHCRMIFIDETHSNRHIYTFTENHLSFQNTHHSFLQKLKALTIQDIIAAITTVDIKKHSLVRNAAKPRAADGRTERVRGLYENFFLGSHELDIEYDDLTNTKVYEKAKFADIIKWRSTDTPSRAEEVHNFIQWMFPNTEPSGARPEIPPITIAEAKAIREDMVTLDQFKVGYEWFLSFLGIGLDANSGVLNRNPDWPQRKAQLDVLGNHNFRRITRMLYALRELGLCDFMGHLYAFLVIHYEHCGAGCKKYWRESFTTDTNDQHNHALYFGVDDFMNNMKDVGLPPEELYDNWLVAADRLMTPIPEDVPGGPTPGAPRPLPGSPSPAAPRPLPGSPSPGAPKFKLGDLCWYTPRDDVRTMIKIVQVDGRVDPCAYRVEDMDTNQQQDVPFEEELVAIKQLTPLQMTRNTKFMPNSVLVTAGCPETEWNPGELNRILQYETVILSGYYRHYRFLTNIVWKDIYTAVIPDDGWMYDYILRFFGHWCCFTYGGLNTDSNAADVAAHLTKARADGTETYIVLQSLQFLHQNMTFIGLDSLWNTDHALRDIFPEKVDNILVTMWINTNHWIIGHIDLKRRVINVYDSLPNTPAPALASLNELKRLFYRRKLEDDVSAWHELDGFDDERIIAWYEHATTDWIVTPQYVPRQEDSNACGAYACMIMAYIMSGNHAKIASDMLFANIPAFRQLMGRIMCGTNCTRIPRP